MRIVRLSLQAALAALVFVSRAAADAPLASDPRVANAVELARVWLEAQRAYERVPGVSAAVVHDQEVLWIGGFGHADLAERRPATADTIYSICSISKLFTSLAVLQLRDAGKLRLDDPVGKHLSWFAIKRTDPDGPEVTVEGLLTHASGLPRESDHPYWTAPDFAFPPRESVIERIKNQETLYPAATYFQYSNLGITLAGEIVAAASGEPYAAYVKRRILEPIGLQSTTPEMPEMEKGRRLATGYSASTREGIRKPMPFFQVRGIAPAAGFASTAADLARFASWQFRVLDRKERAVLGANTLREMQRVHWADPDFETTWGLGFSVWRSNSKTFTGHGGSCPGYRTQLLLRPEEKVATVFMSNALGVNSQQWAQTMYDIVAPAIAAAVKEPSKAKPPDPDLDKYLGAYGSTFGGEHAVVRWEDGLAVVPLPTMEPVKGLIKLKKTGPHTFRRVRKDDALGEPLVFEIGADGRASRLTWHSNHYPRIR